MCTLKILHILRRSEYVAPYRYMHTHVHHSDKRVDLGCPTKEEERVEIAVEIVIALAIT